jgi:hypothetical protein
MEANNRFGISMPAISLLLISTALILGRELEDNQSRSNVKQIVKGLKIKDLRARLHKHAESQLPVRATCFQAFIHTVNGFRCSVRGQLICRALKPFYG